MKLQPDNFITYRRRPGWGSRGLEAVSQGAGGNLKGVAVPMEGSEFRWAGCGKVGELEAAAAEADRQPTDLFELILVRRAPPRRRR